MGGFLRKNQIKYRKAERKENRKGRKVSVHTIVIPFLDQRTELIVG
jgi:hypothetical protein